MPVFLLTIPKQPGGQTIQNNRRAMAVSVDASEADPLEVARGLAAAADAPNSAIWSRATGGWLSDASIAAAGGLVWLDITADTPDILEGDPDGGGELPDTSAVVEDGVAFNAQLNGTALALTPAVAGGEVEGIQTPATSAVVANAGTVPIQNSAGAAIGNGTLAVSGRAVTSARLAATIAGVANAASVPVLPASGSTALASGTAAVSAGAIDGVRLPATSGIVTNGQTLAVDGGTVALSVAANVVTAAFTPE